MPDSFDHAARFRDVPSAGAFEADQVVRDLGDGLVLRRASVRDADALDGFNRVVHADPPDYADIDGLGGWARDLVAGGHPTVSAEDFWIVEDTARGRLASSLGLIGQRMRYDGIAFDAGQIELVGTHPDYRKRGLVRAQMEAVHAASAARGHILQWISGIPWYYRQFGYEMALETDGARVVPRASLPEPRAQQRGLLRLRDATPSDAEEIAACLRRGAARSRLSCDVEPDYWRWEIEAKSARNISRRRIHIIEDETRVHGVVLFSSSLFGNTLRMLGAEVAEGSQWSDVGPFLLESLCGVGERYAAEAASSPSASAASSAASAATSAETSAASAASPGFDFVRCQLGSAHPIYELSASLGRDVRRPYALFVRIPELGAFLQRIAPVLEARLAKSAHAGRSGDLDLNFYRSGLRLRFDGGRLDAVEAWEPTTEDLGHHGFPELSFLQLLTGFRSLRDLQHAFPDAVERSDDHVSWLEALFPAAASLLIPAG